MDQPDIDLVIVLGQTETLCEDGTGIRTVGKARPWVLKLIPTWSTGAPIIEGYEYKPLSCDRYKPEYTNRVIIVYSKVFPRIVLKHT